MHRWDLLLTSDLFRYRLVGRVFFTAVVTLLVFLFVACASTAPDEPETAPRLVQQEEGEDLEPEATEPEIATEIATEIEPEIATHDAEMEISDRAEISPLRDMPEQAAPELGRPDIPKIESIETTPVREPERAAPELILPSAEELVDSLPDPAPDSMSMSEQADRSPLAPTTPPSDAPQAPRPTAPPVAVSPPTPIEPPAVAASPIEPPSEAEQSSAPARELDTRVGEEVSVELPGLGWIYLGSDEPGAPELLRRTHHSETTEFVFRTRGEGSHRLRFQRQDLALGSQETQDLVLNARPIDDSVRLSQEALGEDAPLEGPEIDAERDSSELDGSGARIADMSPEELHAALELSLQEGRDIEAEEILQRLLDAGYVPEASLLRAGAERRAERGEIGGAIDLLEQYLVEYPSRSGRDHVHYLLGSLYEADSEYRNMRESQRHYGIVVNEYPRSRYINASQRRLNYQNRHFFEIR
ncbi:MAG: hypothetical protein EA428_03200 [Spirochaetaceae bacterium]|nr:MAG: hypothetical protein EA428_03200 [Spirochaetaceae bacterium]